MKINLNFMVIEMVKSKVYENTPQTVPYLKEGINTVINNIQPHVCKRVIEHVKNQIIRCGYGDHMPDVILHI